MRNGSGHVWTAPEVSFVVEQWNANASCDQIADRLVERFGIVVSKNAIIGLSKRHRDLMPVKTAEQVRQLNVSAAINRWARRRAA